MKTAIKAALVILFMVLCKSLFAQDPVVVASNVYKTVLLDNDRVRVIEISFKPGETAPSHSHPEHFVYVIAGGKLKITNSEGKVIDAELKNGDVLWLPAETHTATNTGDTEIKLIVNELKK